MARVAPDQAKRATDVWSAPASSRCTRAAVTPAFLDPARARMLYSYPTEIVGIGEEAGHAASFHPGRVRGAPDGGSGPPLRRQGALAHRDQPGRRVGRQDSVS